MIARNANHPNQPIKLVGKIRFPECVIRNVRSGIKGLVYFAIKC
jgi:hypothetical protein